MDVLKTFDRGLAEQVIEVPRVALQDVVPQRAVLRVPQFAEQLVDMPVPESVILAHGRCDLGVKWCQIATQGGRCYWVDGWHSPRPVAPPGGLHRQPRAVYLYWAVLRRVRAPVLESL